MLTLEILPASYGDSLLLSYGTESATHRILIDGGFSATGEVLARRLAELEDPIDLLVVSHVDNDHISGVVKLLDLAGDKVSQIWFNGYIHLDQFSDLLGPVSGEKLTTKLVELGMDWNVGWPWPSRPEVPENLGGPVVMNDGPARIDLPGGAEAILVSPTPLQLAELLGVWEEVVRTAGLEPGHAHVDEPEEGRSDMLGGSLEDLAEKSTGLDDSEANASSIGFVFQWKDPSRDEPFRLLLAGDALPGLLVDSLRSLAEGDEPYELDAFKLPHHTSKKNVTKELIQSVDCPRWIVSTSGKRFNHPNAEALARIVMYGGDMPEIICNYPANIPLTDFADDYPPENHGYRLTIPNEDEDGITLTFSAE